MYILTIGLRANLCSCELHVLCVLVELWDFVNYFSYSFDKIIFLKFVYIHKDMSLQMTDMNS